MAVTITRVTKDLPWEGESTLDGGCLAALAELSNGRPGTLMLINNSTNAAYKVLKWDADESRITLENSDGGVFKPVFTPREGRLYSPLWRD